MIGKWSILLCACMSVYGMIDTPQRVILNGIFSKGYDVNERPNEKEQQQTDVYVQLYINSFGSLDAAHMEYRLDTFLRQRWRDKRLVYTDNKTILIQDKSVLDRIWKPDTFFENVKTAEIHTVTMPNVLFRISQTGDVLYSIRIRMRLACNLQLHHFPLDTQNCILALSSYANTDDIIKYHWQDEVAIDKPKDLTVAQFALVDIDTSEVNYDYVTGNFSGLHAMFLLRRHNGYHLLQTYIPTIMIVSISWVSFWLDPNAIPGRVTLGVTTLLTLTTLASGIRSQLPPVSYVKAIDIWIGMCMIMVFGALLEFTLSNWLANRKAPQNKQPWRIPKMDNSVSPNETKRTTYIGHARALDRCCRFAFPGSFVVFNMWYWPYYLLQQYSVKIRNV